MLKPPHYRETKGVSGATLTPQALRAQKPRSAELAELRDNLARAPSLAAEGERAFHQGATNRALKFLTTAIQHFDRAKNDPEVQLSQEDLAERADLHRTYVGDVERGERNVSLINMWMLSEASGVKLSRVLKDMEKELGK